MLRFFRKYFHYESTFTKILFGVLALMFVIWGVGVFGGEKADILARVYKDEITRHDVDEATDLLRQRYQEMLKGQFGGDLMRSLNLRGQALNQLIDEALLRADARRLGIQITNAEVDEKIMTFPAFQRDGHFNRDLLAAYLRGWRSRQSFEDQIRQDLLRERLEGLASVGAQVSDAEVAERYRLDHEKVNLLFVRVPAADLVNTINPTDEELQKYLDGHADLYRVPPQVRVRYVASRSADFASQATISETQINDYYTRHRDDTFNRPEQVRARHILIRVPPGADEKTKAAARKKAEDLLARARRGSDFAELAKKNSEDQATAVQGGELDFFPRGRMDPAFERAAFEVPVGKVSDVVETTFGLHLIKVEAKRAAGVRTLDEVHEEILGGLRNEQARELAEQQAQADRRAIVSGKPLVEAAAGRKLEETPPFSAGSEIPGVGRLKAFSDTAFALAEGEVSDLIRGGDTIYLLSPFARRPEHAPALADVGERVLADLRRQRSQGAAKDTAEQLLARAKEAGLKQAAAELKMKTDETGDFDRQATTLPKLGNAGDLKMDAFALTSDAPLAPKVYAVESDVVVIALQAKTPADTSGFEAAKDALKKTMLEQKRQVILTAYLEYLRQRAGREGALDVRGDAGARG